MPTRSRTLRNLPPITRKFVRLTDELQSVLTRLKNFRPVIQDLELVARAENAREIHQASQGKPSCIICEYLERCREDPQHTDYCPHPENWPPQVMAPDLTDTLKREAGEIMGWKP